MANEPIVNKPNVPGVENDPGPNPAGDDGGKSGEIKSLADYFASNADHKAEFDKLMQAETDRRVNQALTSREEKAEADKQAAKDKEALDSAAKKAPPYIEALLKPLIDKVASLSDKFEGNSLESYLKSKGIPDDLAYLMDSKEKVDQFVEKNPSLLKHANGGLDMNLAGKKESRPVLSPEEEVQAKAFKMTPEEYRAFGGDNPEAAAEKYLKKE